MNIKDYIALHKAGGRYSPSRKILQLLRTDPETATTLARVEQEQQALLAQAHARRLKRLREGCSRFMPHQAAKERARRIRQMMRIVK